MTRRDIGSLPSHGEPSSLFWLRWVATTVLGVLVGACAGIAVSLALMPMLANIESSLLWFGVLLGPLSLFGALGGAVGQWHLLRSIAVDRERWLRATAAGGVVAIGASAALLFGGAWFIDVAFGVQGLAAWSPWLALNALCALPLAMLQRPAVQHLSGARFWYVATAASVAIAAPAAVSAAAIVAELTLSTVGRSDNIGGLGLSTIIMVASAVGIGVGCAVVSLPSGILMQRVRRSSGKAAGGIER
jgi:hypothetical protein